MRPIVLALACLLAVLSAAPATGGAGATTRVTVTMTDFKFALSRPSARRGTVIFAVVNKGAIIHDFKIAGKKTPIFKAGAGGILKVSFRKPGRYAYICTVPGHAELGMKGIFNIT